jgi:hypothetical protein
LFTSSLGSDLIFLGRYDILLGWVVLMFNVEHRDLEGLKSGIIAVLAHWW